MAKNNQQLEVLLDLNRRVGRLMFRHIQQALQDVQEYTLASMAVLKVLDEHGELSQHQIAKELCHSDAAVSRQVSLLLQKGQVEVKAGTENRKRSMVALSDKGHETIRNIRQLVEGHFKDVFEGLSEDEIATMMKSNQRLLEVLNTRQTKES